MFDHAPNIPSNRIKRKYGRNNSFPVLKFKMSQSLVRKALQQTLQTEEPRKPRTKKRTKKNAPLEDMEFLIDLAAADDIDPASSSCVRKKKRSRASVSETATAHPVENVYWEKKKIKKNEERIVKKVGVLVHSLID